MTRTRKQLNRNISSFQLRLKICVGYKANELAVQFSSVRFSSVQFINSIQVGKMR